MPLRQIKLAWPLNPAPSESDAPTVKRSNPRHHSPPPPSLAECGNDQNPSPRRAYRSHVAGDACDFYPKYPHDRDVVNVDHSFGSDDSTQSTIPDTESYEEDGLEMEEVGREDASVVYRYRNYRHYAESIPPADSYDSTVFPHQALCASSEQEYPDSASSDGEIFSDTRSSFDATVALPAAGDEQEDIESGRVEDRVPSLPLPPLSPGLSSTDSYVSGPDLEGVSFTEDGDILGLDKPFDRLTLSPSKPPPPPSLYPRLSVPAPASPTPETPRKPRGPATNQAWTSPPKPAEGRTPRKTPARPAPSSPGVSLGSPPRRALTLGQRLGRLWPELPQGLCSAPLAVAWEFTRAALHCSVDWGQLNTIRYDPSWKLQDRLWDVLRAEPSFRGRPLPEKCDPEAWRAALHYDFRSGTKAVILAATARQQEFAVAPLRLELSPLRLEQSCRLYRRFGSDRFVELLFPAQNSWGPALKAKGDGKDMVPQWLATWQPRFLDREWSAIWTKDGGRRRPEIDISLGPRTVPIYQDRVYLFAQDGRSFRPCSDPRAVPPVDDTMASRTVCSRNAILDWLLNFERNHGQKHLKLFSRISLGLTKTIPTYVLEEHQIRHHRQDLLSSEVQIVDGKPAIMNDGIGRISLALMRRIRDELGLSDTPSAVQARIGSAKGMWIVDPDGSPDDIWIETYPSQRKWECEWSDEAHRTFEVRSWSSELRPACLNLQFLPILEDRAVDKRAMRDALGSYLQAELSRDLDSLKAALGHPELLRLWAHENAAPVSASRSDRLADDSVPWTGGLPVAEDNVLTFLIDGGFDPTKLRFMWERVVKRQEKKCERLLEKLNIKIGQSAYVFMVVDFAGVLEEDEIHLSFSSKFQDGTGEFADTMLDGMDVLVARAPAHFPSDVQKVRAVFRRELRHLKDVIVFPSKGCVPLAQKLSGGDYDGDRAWVCWDPRIVGNFRGMDPPPEPDLSPFLDTDAATLADLVALHPDRAVDDMIRQGFVFNLQPSFLGKCTNLKERYCYWNNTVGDDGAILLAALLSRLVDQPKQGIVFGKVHLDRVCAELGESGRRPDPLYKSSVRRPVADYPHIIDHLRFNVAEKTVAEELSRLARLARPDPSNRENRPQRWDADLAILYQRFEAAASRPEGVELGLQKLLIQLQRELDQCATLWQERRCGTGSFKSMVKEVYARWSAIRPETLVAALGPLAAEVSPHAVRYLEGGFAVIPGGLAPWDLLKASCTFKWHFKSVPGLPWYVAGRQLQFLKATAITIKHADGDSLEVQAERRLDPAYVAAPDSTPIVVIPGVHRALKPDGKFIRQLVARREGLAEMDGLNLEDGSGSASQ